MSVENGPPQNGQVRVNLAVQVAGIAAQVSAALGMGDADRCAELEAKLGRARDEMRRGAAPGGMVPFLEVMCGLLRGDDVSDLAKALPISFRAVYEQIVDEAQKPADEGDLTLRQVLDEVSYNVVALIKHGTAAQRTMMGHTLQKMQQESKRRPDLQALIVFLDAVRALLREEDPAPFAGQLQGPFQAKWEDILNELSDQVP